VRSPGVGWCDTREGDLCEAQEAGAKKRCERPLGARSGPLRKSPTQQKVIVPTALGRHLSNANRKKVTSGR
jgi:hypothetical protein